MPTGRHVLDVDGERGALGEGVGKGGVERLDHAAAAVSIRRLVASFGNADQNAPAVVVGGRRRKPTVTPAATVAALAKGGGAVVERGIPNEVFIVGVGLGDLLRESGLRGGLAGREFGGAFGGRINRRGATASAGFGGM